MTDERLHVRLLERLTQRIRADESGCWIWTGELDRHGYGRISVRGQHHRAHRLVYALAVGPIPEGLQLDHLCRVRACVNPAHLDPVTNAENHARGERATATHCKNGHRFDEANTYRGRRRVDGCQFKNCRRCVADATRRYEQRQRDRRAA